MNALKLLFYVLVFFGFSKSTFAQTTSSVALNSISHAGCFTGSGDISLQLTVTSSSSPFVIGGYTLVLNKNGVYYSTITSSVLQSSSSIAIPITGLPPGNYVVSGSATVKNPSTLSTYGSPGFANLSFYLGYQAIWNETKEMAVQGFTATVLQNTPPSQTYAAARMSNSEAGSFWFLATPTFASGSTGNRSVYVSLVNTAPLVSFNPSSQNGYLEFRKASTGDGIYYKSTSGIFKLDGVSSSDKIRVVRSGSTLKFFNNQSAAALTSSTNPFSAPLSTPLYLTAFSTFVNDGMNIVSSLNCTSSEDVHASLFDETDGFYYPMKAGKLRFVFNHNYDTQNGLKFNIYNSLGVFQKSQASFPPVLVTYGDNYITLDLTTSSGCIGEGIFVLEVISDKKEKTYLRFYNDYNSCTPVVETPQGESN